MATCEFFWPTGAEHALFTPSTFTIMNTQVQRILVPLDPSEYTEAATLRACEIAKAHDAVIFGLTVLDTPGIRSQVAPADMAYWPLVRDTILSAIEEAKDKIGDLQAKFAGICKTQGVKHAEAEMEGVPAEMILDASALYDLVVTGLRSYFHFETREGPGDSLTKVLNRTATPILAVPGARPEEPFEQVLIAYDGSLNAARTLRDFAAFAVPYNFQLSVSTAHGDEAHARTCLERAAAFLRAHGFSPIETSYHRGDTIPDEALEKANLVVAGIHSKRFFKDMMAGSFTKHLIERGDSSLFLSH